MTLFRQGRARGLTVAAVACLGALVGACAVSGRLPMEQSPVRLRPRALNRGAVLCAPDSLPGKSERSLVADRVLPRDEDHVDLGRFRREGWNNTDRGARLLSPASAATNVLLGSATSAGLPSPGGWVYLNQWYVTGPFLYTNALTAAEQVFPPEAGLRAGRQDQILDFQGPEKRRGDAGSCQWRYLRSDRAAVTLGAPVQSGVWYVYGEILSPDDREVWCQYGVHGMLCVWVNAELTFVSGAQPTLMYAPDSCGGTMRLRKGVNCVVCKIAVPWFESQGPPTFSIGVFTGSFELGPGGTRLSF